MKRTLLALGAFTLLVFAQPSIVGSWEGAIEIQGIELTVIVNFTDSLSASIDIPQQGAKGLALENVSFKAPQVHFELDAPAGRAVFEGELKDGEIKGSFTQGAAKGEFFLKPQVKKVLPYTEEEVTIKVSDDVTLAGTLSMPDTAGPYPAVVLITGSGAQDRDENILGFKVFATIADHLTRQGIAVLRCDDRGFGASTGEGSWDKNTSENYAEDARAQIAYLKTRPEIDSTKVGLLGHSEGGLIAAMVAANNPAIAFVILMAGPALPGERILPAQMEAILRVEGVEEEEITKRLALQRKSFDAARTGQGFDAVRKETRKLILAQIKKMPREQRKAIGNINEYVEQQLQIQFDVLNTAWFRFFLDYDPRPDLAKINCRVLAFYGGKDLQVPSEMDSAALAETFNGAGKTNYLIKVCADANHLFQKAITGAISEYATLPKEFVSCFLPNVSNWILGLPEVPCPGCDSE